MVVGTGGSGFVGDADVGLGGKEDGGWGGYGRYRDSDRRLFNL